MNWSDVGKWLEQNAGKGAALIGSLATGNVPGAVAAGVSMISSATGTNDPQKALAALQQDPQTMIALQKLADDEKDSIRKHLENMTSLQLQDAQKEQEQTQLTIRNGDNSEYPFVRYTRPGQSWLSLFAAIYYALHAQSPDPVILGALLTLPFAYAGLRQIGKGVSAFTQMKAAIGK
jgi:hypothetical protein